MAQSQASSSISWSNHRQAAPIVPLAVSQTQHSLGITRLQRNVDVLFCSKTRISRFRGTRIRYFAISRCKNRKNGKIAPLRSAYRPCNGIITEIAAARSPRSSALTTAPDSLRMTLMDPGDRSPGS